MEILNTIENGSLPLYVLDLKIGVPIMVIRNIDPAAGICNCTRFIAASFGTAVIEAVMAIGSRADKIALVPKIKFTSLATEGVSPFDFTRNQFPVRLAFAMTINKAQGQTLDSVGLYLPCHVFGHGPLYVAFLRVISPGAIKILITDDISIVENHTGSYTHNVVFKEAYNNS
ncbi:hypothetical protein G6F42_019686 [Rhizopus arrhizus]|nr:hypothetical protein G6F42_019686 [Rhizopus arrhizus]